MAFDPVQEDCHRLILGAMRRGGAALTDARFVQKCMGLFEHDTDRLIACDADRSFHLTAKATEILDYRIPFLNNDTEAERDAKRAEDMLREACSLDPGNWDAKRMLVALTAGSNDEYVSFLQEHCAELEDELTRRIAAAESDYDREAACDLMRRPYLRWLAALSSKLLISGRYRMALDVAEKSLAYSPIDQAGVHYTAVLALAKLECTDEELMSFRSSHIIAFRDLESPFAPIRRSRNLQDPWTLIAQMGIAYHSFDYGAAETVLRQLLGSCPNAAECLYFQTEFPDGVYARVSVEPGSQDELILALSEATPLLQEGLGAPDNAGFAAWIATHDLVRSALDKSVLRAAEAQRRVNGGEN